VDVAASLKWLQGTGLAAGIRDSLFLFPLLESAHVFGLALVFGTITVIDLRLLGIASAGRSFQRIASDVLKWTWAGFALTALTGALMFTTNAVVYFNNFYFRTKMALLALAGVNMLVFELTAGRTIRQWDEAPSAPRLGRVVATLSLVLWVAVIFAGRIIGFTTTRASPTEQAPVNVNFEDLLGVPADTGKAPTPPPDKK
jgi:uncharacterized protein DUF6644